MDTNGIDARPRNLFDPAAPVERNYYKFRRETADWRLLPVDKSFAITGSTESNDKSTTAEEFGGDKRKGGRKDARRNSS